MGADRGHRRRTGVAVGPGAALLAAILSLLLLASPASAQGPEPLPPGALGPDGVLSIAVREIKPFAYPTDRGWSGYSIDMWEATADDLDIPYEYVEVASVTEQLDSVASGRTDASLGAISITAERSEVVEFTQPMFDSGLQIMVRAEDDDGLLGVMTALFSRTFLYVLIGLGLLLLIAGHVIWLVERRRNDHFPRTYLAGVWEGVWWAMVTMSTVGYGDRVVTTRSGRVVAMLWMVIAVVLVAQFTALVTSTLTVNRIRSDVENIGDLYGEAVATVEGTSAQRYLADIDLEAEGLPDVEDAEQALLDGDVDAVVYDSPVLRYFARTDGRNDVRVVGPLYQPQGYGMAFAEDSPLVDPVDREFLLLREDGTTEALEDRYFGS
jgi:polar amino acid transport system substrate-binding protein